MRVLRPVLLLVFGAVVCLVASVPLLVSPAVAQDDQYTKLAAKQDAAYRALTSLARQKQRALYVLGHPKKGLAGTAFCIHREARLLVTAAHCSDNQEKWGVPLYAYPQGRVVGGSGCRYRVTRVWHLSGFLKRKAGIGDGSPYYSWRKGGDLDGESADIAILELAGSRRGQPLPAALALYPGKGNDVIGKTAGTLVVRTGKSRFPVRGDRPWTTALVGPVTAGLGIFGLGGPSLEKSQHCHLLHRMPVILGDSGSPLCLPDGKVIGVTCLLNELLGVHAASSSCLVHLIESRPELLQHFPEMKKRMEERKVTETAKTPAP